MRLAALYIAMLGSMGLSGCIRSRVTITSEPPHAEVTWRGEPRGVTPITIPIKWYWYYDFTIEKDGYEKMERVERFRTPPWFLMPLDLFAEIIPIPMPDNRYRHYKLTKKQEQPF
ncbi:PEGA domain-containing protein [Candidatus Sumerlaeota bacterium]|nr:PEGA domain-containing protein [Candidatus Sumerlaeota bacterium]